MSFEREIKEAFMRHAEDVRPQDQEAWSGIEHGVRRSARRQAILSGVALAAIIAVGVAIVPRLAGEEKPGGFATTEPSPSLTPTPSPQPSPPSDTITYREEREGWHLEYPATWVTGWFEGETEFRPAGLPGLPEGGDTFAVTVRFETPDGPVGAGPSVALPAGPAMRQESDGPPHTITYLIDWSHWCEATETPCGEPLYLRVQVFASTDALWEKYGEQGDGIARTIADAAKTFPTGTVRTRQGTIEVEYDARTQALVRFLDARMEGTGAEEWLTQDSQSQYEGRDEAGLYSYGDPPQPWGSYEITERADADANSSEFTVTLTAHEGDAFIRVTETIGVGPGVNVADEHKENLVRFAREEVTGRGVP